MQRKCSEKDNDPYHIKRPEGPAYHSNLSRKINLPINVLYPAIINHQSNQRVKLGIKAWKMHMPNNTAPRVTSFFMRPLQTRGYRLKMKQLADPIDVTASRHQCFVR